MSQWAESRPTVTLTAAARAEGDALAGHASLVLPVAVHHQVVGGPRLQAVQESTLLARLHRHIVVIIIIIIVVIVVIEILTTSYGSVTSKVMTHVSCESLMGR